MADRLELSDEGNVTIVRFKDQKILDEVDIQQLGEELNAVVSSGEHTKIVLNFEEVGFLSSAALGKLIAARKKAVKSDVALKLCSIKHELLEVFKLTGLDSVFDIRESQSDAIAAFEG